MELSKCGKLIRSPPVLFLDVKIVLDEGIVLIYQKGKCDVGSTHPGGGTAPKGLAVRQLKRYASWVQTVVRQVGLYLPQASNLEGSWS